MNVYLNTSAIIKRYFKEENSDKVDEVYSEVWQGKSEKISFSAFNVSEVVGVLYRFRGIF
ncbi:MAG: hypothetical protein MPF33_02690 [Candidatus Aramenus sp.]|jgi:predicted nucleic acid-binding protein|nr:hypothetical protein [Candidatus Aramenus sp.]